MATKDFFEWLNYLFSKKGENDPDLHSIECGLIRSMSEYRKFKLSKIRISNEFNERFLQALEKEEPYSLPEEVPSNIWTHKGFQYALALLLIGSAAGLLSFLGMGEKFSLMSSQTAASLKLDPDIINELQEEFQLIKNIRNSDDLEALRVLETYNLSNGITDRATRIHYTIELLSK